MQEKKNVVFLCKIILEKKDYGGRIILPDFRYSTSFPLTLKLWELRQAGNNRSIGIKTYGTEKRLEINSSNQLIFNEVIEEINSIRVFFLQKMGLEQLYINVR